VLNLKTIKNIPPSSGVYMFKRKNGNILYIGKANNLRNRLASYRNIGSLSAAKQRMLQTSHGVDIKITTSEVEALILEASLIKKHQPTYNILMRDDKNYAFVVFTKERFPKILVTHQPLQSQRSTVNGQQYAGVIGPFTDVGALKNALRVLRKEFPYCDCARGKRGHKRMCVNGLIKKCPGICCVEDKVRSAVLQKRGIEEKNAGAEYKKNIRAIKDVLMGKQTSLLRKLQREMKTLSDRRLYEQATTMRDQIQSLEKIFRHSPYIKKDEISDRAKALRLLKEIAQLPTIPERIEGYDVSDIGGKFPVGSMVVFKDGVPEKQSYRRFTIKQVAEANDPAMIEEMLNRRFAHTEWPLPDFILIDGGKPQLSAARKALMARYIHIIFGAIAKKEEELYLEKRKKPAKLKDLSPQLLHLLQHIRNEAHRFAVSFHRVKRKKSLLNI